MKRVEWRSVVERAAKILKVKLDGSLTEAEARKAVVRMYTGGASFRQIAHDALVGQVSLSSVRDVVVSAGEKPRRVGRAKKTGGQVMPFEILGEALYPTRRSSK